MRHLLISGVFSMIFVACMSTSTDYSKSVPALVENPNSISHDEITKMISKAMDNRKVTLKQDILSTESRVTISRAPEPLDPYGNPLSGRLPMTKPDHFNLVTQKGQCFLHHEQTNIYYPLNNISCKPA